MSGVDFGLHFESIKAVIYTMSGGMKAVIWTDCLQSFVMMFSMIFLSKYFSVNNVDDSVEVLVTSDKSLTSVTKKAGQAKVTNIA